MAKPNFAADVPRGAVVRPLYVERDVKIIGVVESELETIGEWSRLTTSFTSAASFFAALACGIWTNAAFVGTSPLPPEGRVLSYYAAPGLLLASAVCIGFAIFYSRKRVGAWTRIVEGSRTLQQQGPAKGGAARARARAQNSRFAGAFGRKRH